MQGTVGVLIVQGGPTDGQMIPLVGGTNMMGRADGNDVVDTETGVSRQHARITETIEGYFISDLGSSNGTFVNSKRLESGDHPLTDGDEIQLGPSQVVFIFKSDTANTAVFTLKT